MKYKLLCAALFAVGFSVNAAEPVAAGNAEWGYEGQSAPAHWGELSNNFSLCEAGKNQSPIDIKNALKTTHSKLLLAFQTGKQQIVNNGHTIQVNVSAGNTLTLDDQVFELQQFHFHNPSENEINDKQYPLEAHFVFKAKNGELAVLALMLEEGKANTELAKAWQQIPTKEGETQILKTPVNIQALLPAKFDYYRYSGSLTTPPCTEGVTWLVIDRPQSISAEQVVAFASVLHHHNNRPVQPLHGRVVTD